jgi:hypothetical protein
MLPQETYFARDGVRDMFWPHAMNASAIAQVGAHLLPCTLHRCGYRYMCNDRCCRDFLVLQPCDCCNSIGGCAAADHIGLFGRSRGCRVATA